MPSSFTPALNLPSDFPKTNPTESYYISNGNSLSENSVITITMSRTNLKKK
jgi:hypothetical protein